MDHLLPNLDRSNLLNQVEEPKKSLPAGFWTALVTDIAAVLLAAASGFLWHRFVGNGGSLVLPSAVSILFLAASALSAMFPGSRMRRMLSIFLEALGFLAFWISSGSSLLGLAFVAILVFSAWGDSALRTEMEERVRIRILPLTRVKLGKSITGFVLALVLLSMPVWKNADLPLPERQFRSIYESSVSVAMVINPGIKLDSSIQALAESIVRKQMPVDEISIGEEDGHVKAAAAVLLKQAETSLGMDIDPNERSADVFYRYIKNSFGGWQESFGEAFTLFMGVALFIFFRGIGAILNMIATLAAWLLFELLSLSGMVAIIGEPSMQERIRPMK